MGADEAFAIAALVKLGLPQAKAAALVAKIRTDPARKAALRAARNLRYRGRAPKPPLLLFDLPSQKTPPPAPPGLPPGQPKKTEKTRAPSAHRIAPDWAPSERDVQYAMAKGFAAAGIVTEAENFRDYWLGRAPDKKTSSPDWSARWRTWVRNQVEWGKTRKRRPTGFIEEATQGTHYADTGHGFDETAITLGFAEYDPLHRQ